MEKRRFALLLGMLCWLFMQNPAPAAAIARKKGGNPTVFASAMALDKLVLAFTKGDIKELDAYRSNPNRYVALLAQGARHRLRGESRKALLSFRQCVDERSKSGLMGYFHFVCLWALAGMERELGKNREYYLHNSEGCQYLAANGREIAKSVARDLDGFQDFMDSQVAGCRRLGYLDKRLHVPKTSYVLHDNWSKINVSDGMVSVMVDGRPVDFLVDTGDSEITINCNTNGDVCDGMADVGASHTADDFAQTLLVEDKVAKHVIFGPLEVENAYMGTTSSAPSTIGMAYLKRLRHFVVSSRGIYNYDMAEKGALQCTSLEWRYGSISAMQPQLFVDLSTDVGDFFLALDTGSVSGSRMPKTSLFLYGGRLTDDSLIKGKVFHRQSVVLRQHGRDIGANVQFLHFTLNGVEKAEMTGLVWPYSYHSAFRADGILGGEIVSHVALYFDFENGSLCFFDLNDVPVSNVLR